MTGIVWGIVAVTMLLAYGSGFRRVLMYTFDSFGHEIILCWPGTTGEQAGGERAGQKVKFEQADMDELRATATLVKQLCPETVKFIDISDEERSRTRRFAVCAPIRRNAERSAVRGTLAGIDDEVNRRRVVFLGALLKKKLFAGLPAVDETVTIKASDLPWSA